MARPAIFVALLACMIAASASAGPVENVGRPPTKTPFPAIINFRTMKITLARTGCFGSCPSYRVEIDGDGTVRYLGDRYVAVAGPRTAHIPVGRVRALAAQFRKAEFFWTWDSYRARITDLPTYTLAIAFDRHRKEVVDYAGAMRGMPKAITDLEDAVDETAGTARWVKGEGGGPTEAPH